MEKSFINQMGDLFATSFAFRVSAATVVAAGVSLAMSSAPPSALEKVPIDTPPGTELIIDEVFNRIGDVLPLE